MDVEGRRSVVVQREDPEISDVRRGPWTVEEDFKLINYIATHGEGRWNSLARCAGLRRTGKSCRLRWLNYLRPDVRRGNITLEEQLLILELHSRWGNRWSKIAQFLPGRTDNEIKNYWRTRVQKHAKQLKCDVNSTQFKDTMRYLWMPRLVERIQAAANTASSSAISTSAAAPAVSSTNQFVNDLCGGQTVLPQVGVAQGSSHSYSYTPDNSSAAASSDSFVAQVSPVSELTDYYHIPVNNNPNPDGYFQAASESLVSPCGFYNSGSSSDYFGLAMDPQMNNSWLDGGDAGAGAGEQSLWNADDFWFLQQQFNGI